MNKLSLLLLIFLVGCSQLQRQVVDPSNTRAHNHSQYTIPDKAWDVFVEPPQHGGESAAMVQISSSYIWPKAIDGKDIHYRINVIDHHGRLLTNVGRLIKSERFAVVVLASDTSQAEWLRSADEYAELLAQEQRTLEGFISALSESQLAKQPLAKNISNQLDTYLSTLTTEQNGAADLFNLLNSSVSLQPFVGDEAVLQQQSPEKQPRVLQFDWLKRMDKPGDICHRRYPSDCVRLRMVGFKFHLCQALNPNGSLRFVSWCQKIDSMLRSGVEYPVVPCRIKDNENNDAGLAGFVDINGTIFLDGDTFITSDCAEATLVHEMVHALDDPKPNLKKYGEVKQELRRLQRAKKQAELTGDQVSVLLVEELIKKAIENVKLYRPAAAKERINSECKAFFATIDNGDIFDYPGKGTAWMKHNVKVMMNELLDVRSNFKIPDNNPEFCRCVRKLSRWVDGQPPLLENFKNDVYLKAGNEDVMWDKAFNMLPGLYCN